MLTRNEAPWIEYLEIDEATRERKLRDDIPSEIRKKYEEYLLEIKSCLMVCFQNKNTFLLDMRFGALLCQNMQ